MIVLGILNADVNHGSLALIAADAAIWVCDHHRIPDGAHKRLTGTLSYLANTMVAGQLMMKGQYDFGFRINHMRRK